MIGLVTLLLAMVTDRSVTASSLDVLKGAVEDPERRLTMRVALSLAGTSTEGGELSTEEGQAIPEGVLLPFLATALSHQAIWQFDDFGNRFVGPLEKQSEDDRVMFGTNRHRFWETLFWTILRALLVHPDLLESIPWSTASLYEIFAICARARLQDEPVELSAMDLLRYSSGEKGQVLGRLVDAPPGNIGGGPSYDPTATIELAEDEFLNETVKELNLFYHADSGHNIAGQKVLALYRNKPHLEDVGLARQAIGLFILDSEGGLEGIGANQVDADTGVEDAGLLFFVALMLVPDLERWSEYSLQLLADLEAKILARWIETHPREFLESQAWQEHMEKLYQTEGHSTWSQAWAKAIRATPYRIDKIHQSNIPSEVRDYELGLPGLRSFLDENPWVERHTAGLPQDEDGQFNDETGHPSYEARFVIPIPGTPLRTQWIVIQAIVLWSQTNNGGGGNEFGNWQLHINRSFLGPEPIFYEIRKKNNEDEEVIDIERLLEFQRSARGYRTYISNDILDALDRLKHDLTDGALRSCIISQAKRVGFPDEAVDKALVPLSQPGFDLRTISVPLGPMNERLR